MSDLPMDFQRKVMDACCEHFAQIGILARDAGLFLHGNCFAVWLSHDGNENHAERHIFALSAFPEESISTGGNKT